MISPVLGHFGYIFTEPVECGPVFGSAILLPGLSTLRVTTYTLLNLASYGTEICNVGIQVVSVDRL